MRLFSRAACLAAYLVCALGIVGASAPGLATDLAGGAAAGPGLTATAMLAAVTAPLIAADVRGLSNRPADFSSDPAASADLASGQDAAASLAELVDRNASADAATDEENCLAASVYYESKGEPLNGQLAVAQTIMNRAASGRFSDSVCGVVRQPGQFSFLHSGAIPAPPHASGAWSKAVAIARIARDGMWKQIAPAALYFHARRASPGWSKVRVASIGNHIFFR